MSSVEATAGPAQALDGAAVRRWLSAARSALDAAKDQIDGLNVFPVPDADTGTNLLLTIAAASEAAEAEREPTAAAVLHAAVRGATLGARGNSGVILSALLRGIAEGAGPGGLDGPGLAAGLREASRLGYEAVGSPVEGTILTVARAAADAAARAAAEPLPVVATAAADAARTALSHTPEQLDLLARAGVVDAGGAGYALVLDALAECATGAARPPLPSGRTRPASGTEDSAYDPTPGSPAYEVMYLLDCPDEQVPGLREELAGLGDSLVVVGGEGTWNVHVHVDDAGAAVEAGIRAGRPHRVRITHLGPLTGRGGRAVVAVASGPGLELLLTDAGARVVRAEPPQRATTEELLAAAEAAGAAEVVLLPNDASSRAAAEAAAIEARQHGLRVAVVPVSTSVQALAAMAVHEPSRPFEDDVIAMTSAGRHARHGGVTVATREGVTSAGRCRVGDVLGVVDGDFVLIGDDLAEVARQVAELMLASGGELVTLVLGRDGTPELAEGLLRHLVARHPALDVAVHDGGQPRYPLLIGVE